MVLSLSSCVSNGNLTLSLFSRRSRTRRSLCPHLHENPQPIRTRWFDVQCWALAVSESPLQISRGEKPLMNRKKIAWGILFAGVVAFAATLVSEPFSAAQ